MCEAMVAVTSGVFFWMGAWDLIEECIPDYWYVKLAMIFVGGGTLVCMGRMSSSEPSQVS